MLKDLTMSSELELSVVIPCYRSSGTIEDVVRRLGNTLSEVYSSNNFEIVLVNDGSDDSTEETIFRLSDSYASVKAISLSNNFGQQAALMAGLSHTQGNLVAAMDDDGETPPEALPELISKLKDEQLDVVYASYPVVNEKLWRRIGSQLNEAMVTWLMGKPKSVYISSYVVLRRFIVEEILRYENPFPYITGQIFRTTKRIGNVEIQKETRIAGSSGYTLKSLINLWLNGFTSFSVKPLRVISFAGAIFCLIGFIGIVFEFLKVIITSAEPQVLWIVLAAFLLLGGCILLALGLIGEYLGRAYLSINNIPQYVIRSIRGFNTNAERTKE